MSRAAPRQSEARRPGLNLTRRVKKLVRRRRYRRTSLSANPHHEDLKDYVGFVTHVLKTNSIHLIPQALRCLEETRAILTGELSKIHP